MWPLHTWLPDAHTEAPDGRLGAAGRRAAEDGHVRPGPGRAAGRCPRAPTALAPLARRARRSSAIVYGALACLAQTDLKRLIAYSSVGHMGFVLLGIATLTAGRHQRRAVRQRRARPDHRPAVLPGRRDQGPVRHRRPATSSAAACCERLPRLGRAARVRRGRPASGCPGWPGSGARCSRCSARTDPAPGCRAATYLTFMALAGARRGAHRRVLPAAARRVTHGPVVRRRWRGRRAAARRRDRTSWSPGRR